MKKRLKIAMGVGIIILVIILAPIIIILSARGINSLKYRISTETGIQEDLYVPLNGAEQFIRIRGEKVANPVIVFLHGGPGSPMTGFLPHYLQTDLEDDYTFVHWDQRGSGRTYMRNSDFSVDELSIELLLDDLDLLVDYLSERFGQKQVIIMGHSWGTVLGTRYVLTHPEKVSAYIAIGYAMNLQDGNVFSGNEALALAEIAENSDDVNALQKAIPLFSSANALEDLDVESFMTIRQICFKYLSSEGEMSANGQIWAGLSSPYMNFDDIKWFLAVGSFEKTCKATAPLMDYAMFNYDANALDYKFEVPIYIVQGEYDWITPSAMVEEYFKEIDSPKKEFIILPNTGHIPYLDNPKEFSEAVRGLLE